MPRLNVKFGGKFMPEGVLTNGALINAAFFIQVQGCQGVQVLLYYT
jgi:hypothetical protein